MHGTMSLKLYGTVILSTKLTESLIICLYLSILIVQ